MSHNRFIYKYIMKKEDKNKKKYIFKLYEEKKIENENTQNKFK